MLSTSDLIDLTQELEEELDDIERVGDASRRWLIARMAGSMGHQQMMELMTETVTAISAEATIAQAASQMLKRRVHRLPVVDQKERLLGILSMTDILGAFVEAAPAESLETAP